MKLILWIFVLACIIESDCSTKSGINLIVYFKDTESANNGIAYGRYANSNYGHVDVKRSSIDPNITIWRLSSSLTDEYVNALIEYLRNDISVEEIEEEAVFHTQIR